MSPEAVIAVMACSKLGAVWLPIFSGFAADAVAVRLSDAGAKVLITADGFPRRGKAVPMKETADDAFAGAPTVEHVLVWRRLRRTDTPWNPGRDVDWDDLLAAQPGDPFPSEPLDPEHPLFIAYSSGTTGKPKGAVHVHGGFLVKIAEEVAYQADLHRGEILYWFADLGWIMGPREIVGATALGSTVFLYERPPTTPRRTASGRWWNATASRRSGSRRR
jgi:acetyl-CoA synthetase